MARPPLRTTAGRFWGALFLALLITGFAAGFLWILVFTFLLAGTFGHVVGGALLVLVVLEIQRSVVHMLTHWRPSFAELLVAALPGIVVAVLMDRAGAGAAAGFVACGIQALVLRIIAPSPELDVHPSARPRPATFSEIRRALTAEMPAPGTPGGPAVMPPPATPADDIDWRN